MMFNRVNIYDDDCQQYHHQHNKKLKNKWTKDKIVTYGT